MQEAVKYTETRLSLRSLGDDAWEVSIAEDWLPLLGETQYLEVAPAGTAVPAGTRLALVESAKSVTELALPADALVLEVNAEAVATPRTLGEGAGRGWFARVRSETLAGRALDPDDYRALWAKSAR